MYIFKVKCGKGYGFLRPGLKMAFFGLKLGLDLEKSRRHTPHQEFQRVPPGVCSFTFHLRRDLANILFTLNRKVTILNFLWIEFLKSNSGMSHSRPQRPRSFWPVPRIATSGPIQHRSPVSYEPAQSKLTNIDWMIYETNTLPMLKKSWPARTFFKRSRDSWKKRGLWGTIRRI